MIKKYFALVGIIGGVTTSCGASSMNHMQVLSFTIANKGMTRISIEGDQIVRVLGIQKHIKGLLELDKTGQIFVKGSELKEKTYISFITKKGVAQDVTLIPISKEPQPIILIKEDREEEKGHQKNKGNSLDIQLSRIIQYFAKDRIPAHFHPSNTISTLRPLDGFESKLISSWHSNEHQVFIYECKNTSDQDMDLREPTLSQKEDLALWVEHRHLSDGETTKIITIQQKK